MIIFYWVNPFGDWYHIAELPARMRPSLASCTACEWIVPGTISAD